MEKQSNRILQILLILTAAILTSCSQQRFEESIPDNYPEDGIIRICTQNHGYKTGWDNTNLNQFGIYVRPVQITDPSFMFNNILVTKNATAWDSQKMYWQSPTTPTNIWAYAPYNKDITNKPTAVPVNIKVDQRKADNLLQSDFIAYRSTLKPATGLVEKNLQIDFKHLLSLLKITIHLAPGLSDGKTTDLEAVLIEGITYNGTCDLTAENPKVVPSSNEYGSLQPYISGTVFNLDGSADVSLECIVMPDTIDKARFIIRAIMKNAVIHLWKFDDGTDAEQNVTEFKPGEQYKLSLDIKKVESESQTNKKGTIKSLVKLK